jgi:hypothetical protein
MIKIIVFASISLFSVTTWSSDKALFWVTNDTSIPGDYCVAEIEINKEKTNICGAGQTSYCPNQKLITLKRDNPNQNFILSITHYDCKYNTPMLQVDPKTCLKRIITTTPGQTTTVKIVGVPNNVIGSHSKIVCNIL